jgi:hypothetical protein
MPATYAPGAFGTLIGKSGLRLKPTRTSTSYRKCMGFKTLCSLYGLSAQQAGTYVLNEFLSSITDNLNRRWIYM